MRNKGFSSVVKNQMKLTLPSCSVNEGVARAVVAAFCAQLDPAASELADVKCAVSEAVTNCIVHAYRDSVGSIYITVKILEGNGVRIEVRDRGCGITDVKAARQPLFTTDPSGERSGMGFTVMENFMDILRVRSKPGKGTVVIMFKRFAGKGENK
ncbi:MAG: anti-sigma F factor [Eubacteriales bacterium]|jgi:stage II sporulation protein AB (anti-sigma F factor)